MNKLTFKLTTNKEVIIAGEFNYFIKDDVINFTDKENIYRYNTSKHILNKENKESIMNIDMQNDHIIYVYKELNKEFKLPIKRNNLLKENNKIIYEYEVEDNDIINIIEISY
jgi:hypothetical protein